MLRRALLAISAAMLLAMPLVLTDAPAVLRPAWLAIGPFALTALVGLWTRRLPTGPIVVGYAIAGLAMLWGQMGVTSVERGAIDIDVLFSTFRLTVLLIVLGYVAQGMRWGRSLAILAPAGCAVVGLAVTTLADVDPAPLGPTVQSGLTLALVVFGVHLAATQITQVESLQRRVEMSSTMALTDQLTGLPNRRALERRLVAQVGRARSSRQGSAVLLLDIDHFKRVNDELGHDVGDEVIRAVAATVRAVLRPDDMVGRWGGEEFLVVLPDADGDMAEQIAERARAAVADLTNPTPVTASFGVAAVAPDDGVAEVVRRADLALYAAKRQGRDRVVRILPGGRSAAAPAPPPARAVPINMARARAQQRQRT